MGTTPIVFTDGTQGSASQVLQAFGALSTQGQQAINALVILRENTLLLFNNALSALNSRRVRANRLEQVGIAAEFVTSDLQDINQPTTTASMRCDSNSVSLKERNAPTEATVQTAKFSASEGTIQALSIPQTGTSGNLGALYRVATSDGSTPTGTFDIQLLDSVNVSLVILDMMNTPSNADITVYASQTGITYTPAVSVTRNGYRVGAWFTPQDVQYIRIVITPALPDVLGGNVFTFGLTDFHAFFVQYHLRSDLYTNQIQITPQGAQLQFVADQIPGVTFFLSFGGSPAIELSPGDIVNIPGTTVVTNQNVNIITPVHFVNPANDTWLANTVFSVGNTILDTNGNVQIVYSVINSSETGPTEPTWSTVGGFTIDNNVTWIEQAWGQLNYTLPTSVYLPSLTIVDAGSGEVMRIAPGLPNTTIGLTNQYICVNPNGTLYIVMYNQAVDQSRTFDVSYVYGPSSVSVSLQAELTTSNLNNTPIFSGASLIYV